MSTASKIEWTERTWNPVVGCTVVSPGCTNCYAMKMARRLELMGHASYAGLTQVVSKSRSSSEAVAQKGTAVWTGKLALNEKALLEPLRRKVPTTWFVNSMGDLFHEDCPDEWIDRVFAVMALRPQHTFQVLTKRSARMREYCNSRFGTEEGEAALIWAIEGLPVELTGQEGGTEYEPLPNVWLGVSVEDQRRADERVPDLLATPAAIRFLSCEPLLGPVDLFSVRLSKHVMVNALSGATWDELGERGDSGSTKLDWIIAGGESGKGARPMHPDWARSLRDQCAAAGVPFFMKQLSSGGPRAIKNMADFPDDLQVREVPNAA